MKCYEMINALSTSSAAARHAAYKICYFEKDFKYFDRKFIGIYVENVYAREINFTEM